MKSGVSQQKYFYYMCGRSQAIGTVACSSHYINRDTLYQVIQEDIQRNAKLFSEDTEKAVQKPMELKCADQQKQTATMKRDLASAKKRLADHIFTMFIADYDTERATLKANIAEMEKVRDTKTDIDRFMLHELIDRITIYEASGMGAAARVRKSALPSTTNLLGLFNKQKRHPLWMPKKITWLYVYLSYHLHATISDIGRGWLYKSFPLLYRR